MKATGNQLECKLSGHFHQQGTPLLISHQILRAWGCGQVDIAVISSRGSERVIRIIESKGGVVIGRRQRTRLQHAAHFLSQLLNLPSQLEIISKQDGCQLVGGSLLGP